ncbi:MAG TPA: nitrate- and nitrite sensing domain-containing protein, partial [Stackebrandtia sp.]|uniref:sensor histidine kinase n=1 Tax=Stackebrandtia sp. TaxID=2023065 RepID=UPI002D6E4267
MPVLALIGVASIRLIDSSSNALAAEDSAQIAQFTAASSKLLDSLQTERAQAAIQLNKKELHLPKDEESVGNFVKSRKATDKLMVEFRAARSNLADNSDNLKQTFDDIAKIMDKRGDLYNARNRISDGTAGAGDLSPYNAVVTWLQNIYEYAVNATDDKVLARDLRAIRLISSADEDSEQMRMIMLTLPDGGTLAPEKYRTFVSEAAGRTASLLEFDRIVSPAQNLPVYESDDGLGGEGADAHDAGAFEDSVLNGSPETSLHVDHQRLIAAYNARHHGSLSFVKNVRDQAVDDANDARNSVVRQVLIEIAVVLITLVVAVLLALVIARSLALSLRRLREGALEVAHVDLPRAVASMRDSGTLGQRTPDQVVAELGDPLQMDNQDEVGTVAGAFNAIHREAVRIAAEQAALRSSVSNMFVNLARRSQNLVDRLIGHLDRLERGEEDPDRLGDLFQLDHLATRMRRNDENLLVLAGADSTRVERNPAQIGDVLRASQSEVDQYTRVEFGTVLADSEVQAGAVNDIVHLVAELLDNATSFSPPDTSVIAEARQVDEEILVRITDRGVGMSTEKLNELNQQMADPGDADVSAPRMMGLVVVARLAQR